jgi:hypothetical protein
MRLIDLTAQVFGDLTVLSRVKTPGRRTRWLVRCSCGKEQIVQACNLVSGHTRSCGHLRSVNQIRKRGTATGRAYATVRTGGWGNPWRFTSEFCSWVNMKNRCLKPTNKGYRNYGGRGITICERWLASFSNFLADMGRRPSSAHSLDRIDNDGNYELSNCRWATVTQQNANKRHHNQHTPKTIRTNPGRQ